MNVDVTQSLEQVHMRNLPWALVSEDVKWVEHGLEIYFLEVVGFLFHFFKNYDHLLSNFLRFRLE